MLRQIVGSIAITVVVLCILGGIAYAKFWQIEQAAAAPPTPESPVAVRTAVAQPTSFRLSSTVVGTALAPRSVRLQTELTGTITQIPMVAGSTVKAGDLLVELDSRIEQAQLKSAKATRRMADSVYRRNKQANAASAISEMELEQSEATLAQADAEIERLQALIDKKTLRAPFDAEVGLFDLHQGQYLPEGTLVTTLQGIEDYLHIDFTVPQHVADEIKIGQQVLLLSAGADLSAEVIAIDSQADRVSRSLNVRAKLTNPPESLKPNDSLKVLVEYGASINAVSVPASAVRRSPTGTFVFLSVLDKEGVPRAVSREVRVGLTQGNSVALLSGVEAGERVVADGSFKVRDNILLAETEISSQ